MTIKRARKKSEPQPYSINFKEVPCCYIFRDEIPFNMAYLLQIQIIEIPVAHSLKL